MSAEKKGNKTFIKGVIIVIGTLSISAVLAPFVFDYFSDKELIDPNNNIIKEQEVLLPVEKVKQPRVEIPQQQKTEIIEQSVASAPANELVEKPIVENKVLILPTLQESDQFVLNNMPTSIEQGLLIPLDMIRNMVVFIDNFSQGKLSHKFSPLIKPTEPFSVLQKNGTLVIDSKSYHRYDRYAKMVNAIDVERFIYFYTLLSPLIDKAYQDIGYPEDTFNRTLDKAIVHLLQTPVIHYELTVITPSVMYKYADENLELLPDTQKLMLRMGPDNLQLVQEKLREIKNELQRL